MTFLLGFIICVLLAVLHCLLQFIAFVIMRDCRLYPKLSPQYTCLFVCLLGQFFVRNIVSFCAFSLQSFANWSIMIFRLLSENPSLLQLYRDLVITHVISSEEFWSQHALQYMQKHQNQKQDVGVSGAFLVCFGLQL